MENAPPTIQRVMDVTLSTINWHHALVYFYDIVVISKVPKDHMKRTRSVLRLLKDAAVTLQQKSVFFTNRIEYLGLVIKHGKLEVANHTADAIRKI